MKMTGKGQQEFSQKAVEKIPRVYTEEQDEM